MADEAFMRQALRLARRGAGWVSPNPMVGAVIVSRGEVIGKGYHRRFGGDHAEVDAIKRCRRSPEGATLYVNLEPCTHWGKTPPCVEAIVEAGVRRVVIATRDPNPMVAGKGVEFLRRRGVEVTEGVLEAEARDLNRAFFKFHREGLPWVTLKWAQSLDGRIATSTGASRWITSEEARRHAHRLRALHDAVIVGVGTVLADDPLLTVRHLRGRNPLRVILDSRLRTPVGGKVLGPEAPTLIATTQRAEAWKASAFEQKGVELVELGEERVDLRGLLRELAKRGVLSVLVEGGREALTSFLKEGLADEVVVFLAPKIMGEGIGAVGDLGVKEVERALKLEGLTVRRVGPDLVLQGRLRS